MLCVFGKSFSQDLTDELLLHYAFNGNAIDNSGNNYDGSVFGATFGIDRFGNPNSAAYFDGINDYINFPNINELKPDLPVSFAFWIKFDDATYVNSTVFNTSFEENVNTGVYMNIQSSTSKYQVSYGDGSNYYTGGSRRTHASDATIEPNEWHHIVIVVNSALNMKMYVDCVEYSGNYSGSGGQLQYSNHSGTIGRHDRSLVNSADYFKGVIDDFRYWNRELTDDDVFELLGFNESIVNSTNPTNCSSVDGTITVTGLILENNYTITYALNSITETISIPSNVSESFAITELVSGVYSSIRLTDEETGCDYDLGEVELIAPTLSATISSSNPIGCGSEDGEIAISGLSNITNYTISYDLDSVAISVTLTSDTAGEIIIDNLAEGNYTNITIEEVSSGCADTLDSVVLVGADLSASITSTNPTSCGSEDGEITISGLLNSENYTISYDLDSVSTSVTLTSNSTGEIAVEDLGSGSYTNIIIEEVLSGCLFGLELIVLNCQFDNLSCFKITPFFTPNGDGINEFWFLKPINQNNICSYELFIFNRYGKFIKLLTNTDSQWDGNYNGRKMPTSDYWFVVYYNEGENDLVYKSHFALKR